MSYFKVESLFIICLILFQSCGTSDQQTPSIEERASEIWDEHQKAQEKLSVELRIINDLDSGIIKAKQEAKPIFLLFTGHSVINSKKLEDEIILKNEKVFSLMKNQFINVWLYVDDKSEQGDKWSDLQINQSQDIPLPRIHILDSGGTPLEEMSYQESKTKLLPLLQKYAQ